MSARQESESPVAKSADTVFGFIPRRLSNTRWISRRVHAEVIAQSVVRRRERHHGGV